MKMGKKFYAVLDLEDDDSSHDEIEVVPFVKPTPLVIHLDVSDDEEEEGSSKKKSETKVRANGEVRENGNTSRTPSGAKMSPNDVDKAGGGGEGDKINVDTSGDVNSKDVVVVPYDAVPSSATTKPSDSSPPLPEIRIAQSIFETEDEPHDGGGGGKVSKDSRATPKKSGKGKDPKDPKDPKGPTKRKRQSSAGSGGRTAEEIQKLLTALGVLGDQQQQQQQVEVEENVDVDVNAISLGGSVGPVKKKSKKTAEPTSTGTATASSISISPPKKQRKPRKSQVGVGGGAPSFPLTLEDAGGIEVGGILPLTLEALMEPPEVPSLKSKRRGRPKKSLSASPAPAAAALTTPPPSPKIFEGYPTPTEAGEVDVLPVNSTSFVSVEEESASVTSESPVKKGGKKRGRISLEKPPENAVSVEDAEFTTEELAAVNLNRLVTNVISSVGGNYLADLAAASPQKKKQKQKTSKVFPEEEDPVESISVVVGEGPRVVRLHDGTSPQTDVISNVNSNVNSPSTSRPAEMNYLPSTWSPDMMAFYDTLKDENMTMSQVLNRMPGDRQLWSIPTGRGVSNKHMKRMRSMRCENCKQWGHLKRQCPEPRKIIACIFCGQRGHNYNANSNKRSTCRKTMCLNCGKNQDRFSAGCEVCTFTRTPPVCTVCSLQGHRGVACPDNWRRFHSTTTVAYVNKSFVANEEFLEEPVYNNGLLPKAEYRDKRMTFCANCGRKGHLFHMCRQKMNYRLAPYKAQKPIVYKELSHSSGAASKLNTSGAAEGDGDSRQKRKKSETSTSTSTSSVLTSPPPPTLPRKVTVQEEVPNNSGTDAAEVETIRIEIANHPAEEKMTFFRGEGETWKCANHPECSNTPSLGQSCHTMFLIPCDHAALLEAQENDLSWSHIEMEKVKSSNEVQICVLSSRHVAHIFGHNHVHAKEDILQLVKKLKTPTSTPTEESSSSRAPIPEVPGLPETIEIVSDSQGNSSSTEFDETKTLSPPQTTSSPPPAPTAAKAAAAEPPPADEEIVVLPPQKPPSPEIITLDDSEEEEDEESEVAEDGGNTPKCLSVSLLPSEWDLIFPQEKFKRDDMGILALLSSTFGVSIFVSKESLTVTIQDGEDEGRVLAKENLVFWLECQAGGVKFSLQYEKRKSREELLEEAEQSNKRGKHYERNKKRRMKRLKSHLKRLMNDRKFLDEGVEVEGQGEDNQGVEETGSVSNQGQQISPPEIVDFEWRRDLMGDGRVEMEETEEGGVSGVAPSAPGAPETSRREEQSRSVGGGGGGLDRQGPSRSRGGGGNNRRFSRWDSPNFKTQQIPTTRPMRYFNSNPNGGV